MSSVTESLLIGPTCKPVLSYTQRLTAHIDDYLQTVLDWPQVRENEFSELRVAAGLHMPTTLLEVPSEGRMLSHQFPDAQIDRGDLLPLDLPGDRQYEAGVVVTDWSFRGLSDNRYDAVLAIVPIHHATVEEKCQYVGACLRVLKPGGVLCFGEVDRYSKIAKFLDGFVDANTPTGHRGDYPDAGFSEVLSEAGFTSVSSQMRSCSWQFASIEALQAYVTRLFCLMPMPLERLLSALRENPGIEEGQSGNSTIRLNWSLRYFRGVKPTLR